MKPQERVLCIVGKMDAGGAETFLMKMYREIDKEKYQMDFLVSTEEEGHYDEEIKSLGGKLFNTIPKRSNPLKSFINIMNIVKREEYKHVLRISQHSLSALDLFAAKLGGAQRLIFRSSNSRTGGGRVAETLHKLFKWLPRNIPTVKIAPSTEAATFMFGEKDVDEGKVKIIKNALNIDYFEFDSKYRRDTRKHLNVENKFVVGHIGRFSSQKNHSFLIDIFSEIYKKNENSVLLLVGKGELETEIKEKIKKVGLEDHVLFIGVVSDIRKILMAMDVYIFPSFYEGLPNTVIEAQATSLPCVISEEISKEVKIIDSVEFVSLEETPENWAKVALEAYRKHKRENPKEEFINSGYDINLERLTFENTIYN